MRFFIKIAKFFLKPFMFLGDKYRRFFSEKLTRYYFVSYPKSGRTWARVFLSKYFSLIFGIPINLNFTPLVRVDGKMPRVAFSHASFDKKNDDIKKNIAGLKNKKVILMIRDPRDVVVSYYFHYKKRDPYFGGEKDRVGENAKIDEFARNEKVGIKKIIDFMNLWYEGRNIFEDFILIKYEDCRRNPGGEFGKFLDFLCIDKRENILNEAIKYSSFENMKKLEKDDALQDDRLRASDPNDPESFKVRRGKVGGYKDYFSEDTIKFMEEQMKLLNRDFGYGEK